MSRRGPPAPDRTEANRATLKALVKLESNKSCADCKRNKHPRWASWNVGVFVCIRCSGIHRGMGTHISRVKSVDLDSWTDEQTQSMLKWGNGRANRYWESKLAEGHVPNEAKIENFIRTKYDSKRWVMEGGLPDPSTLDDGTGASSAADDNVPLNVVREKAIARSASGRVASTGGAIPQPPRARAPPVDLFGDMEEPAARPSTTEPSVQRQPGPPKAPVAPPKQTKPGEGLLGLDFFGSSQTAPPSRPASTGPTSPGAVPGRADLKSSILSLYASKPATPQQAPAQSQSNVHAFGGMQSPPVASPTNSHSNTQSLSGLGDAFGSLSFNSTQQTQPPQAKASPFSNLTSPTGHSRQSSMQKPALSGGSFFDAKPAPPSKPTPPPQQPMQPAAPPPPQSFDDGWGDFSSAPAPAPTTKSPPPIQSTAPSSSGMGDLFDMASPAPAPPPKPSAPAQKPATNYNAFNLSAPAPPKPTTATQSPTPTTSPSAFGALSGMDAWGSNDAWATPEPAPAAAPRPAPPAKSPPPIQSPAFDAGGWGDPTPAAPAKPAVTTPGGFGGDDEFGGWSHASPVAQQPPSRTQGGGGGSGAGQDDLFGNVWQ